MNESLRRSLEALNRGKLPEPIASPRQGRPRVSRQPARRAGTAARGVRPIPGLLRMAEVVRTSAGPHARVCLPLHRLWPGGAERVLARCHTLARQPGSSAADRLPTAHDDFTRLVNGFPGRVFCLDLETCGFSGAALFLIGLLRKIDDELVVELLLARTYAEEHAVLMSFWRAVAACDVMVTFNGKSFDWPFIADRSRRFLMFSDQVVPEFVHLDVLHHARRRWRATLPDCRLQTLEAAVCQRRRLEDIRGSQIPATYAEYVRTGFERDLDAILFHNAMDLVTLLDLAMRLAR